MLDGIACRMVLYILDGIVYWIVLHIGLHHISAGIIWHRLSDGIGY